MGSRCQVEDQLWVGEGSTDWIVVEEDIWECGARRDLVSACSGRVA
jgi:hypothetical protein